MKKNLSLSIKFLLYVVLIPGTTSLLSFQKGHDNISSPGKSLPASSYSVEVLDKWMDMQIKLMSSTVASFNGPFVRIYSYSGIAAYLSVYPGIAENSANRFSAAQLNQIPDLPKTDKNKKYHWPSSLNAALAFMSRAMFPSTNSNNKAAIDSLEILLNNSFNRETDLETIERSASFGKQVAQTIYDWSETDGYRFSNDPYTAPGGPGKWEPTPPSYAKASTPYWGRLRTIVKGSIDNAQPPSPPPYSEDTASNFYKMVNEVYVLDRNLNPEQKNIALFWRDINPGITAPGHWLNVLRQVFQIEKPNSKLDKAVFVFALTGISLNDAWISSWKARYIYNLLRPVTYVRKVMGHRDWLPLLATPPHPEYTAGFAAMAGAITESLAIIYGNDYHITDHTYDQFGFAARKYDSFQAMGKEAADSKFYGGIHYRLSVDMGLWQGREVAKNIVSFLLHETKPAKP
ncbi:MAG TPA: vanadium-dependent haloperoxidase [Chitinophagaceae bacterium]|nr:vanadium-dependent haloperoxidase [Chitinophagaceae bacterium]